MPTGPVLVVNVGSSSVKTAVYKDGEEIERSSLATEPDALAARIDQVRPVAVGHRIVHGGSRFQAPVRITPDVLAELETLIPFAHLHLPPELNAIRLVEQLFPALPQFACFDTSFHRTLPLVERHYGLPGRYFSAGIQKYGFHGLSYQSIASQLPQHSARAATGKTIVCHLGSGASICGMIAGQSVTTSMGFTPLDGLLMGTRCGRIDPGVLLYLLRHDGLSVDQLEHLLERESGLLGVSGISNDLRKVLADPGPEATLAVSLFCRMAAKEIAAAIVPLAGLDALVFTAGIGEHCPQVRREIVRQFAWLGLELDDSANELNALRLHTSTSRVEVFCLPTNEERVIAQAVSELNLAPNP